MDYELSFLLADMSFLPVSAQSHPIPSTPPHASSERLCAPVPALKPQTVITHTVLTTYCSLKATFSDKCLQLK